MDILLPGTEVKARGLRWEVVESHNMGEQTMFRLRGLENATLGVEIDLLVPFENIDPVTTEINPEMATVLRNWLVYHQAFLLEQALGMNAILAVQPGRLKIEPYQLVPVMRAIRMSRPRLFLCDSVGLGKTIQACLVVTELMARRLAHRVLIVSPAGPLLEQWKTELSERFGLRFEELNRAKLDEIRKSRELGENPFDHVPLGIVSIDFLKQERVLDQIERSSYDIVIVDEAHHCMDLGKGQSREDSQRRKLAEVVARNCDCLLLLTATPHDGYDRSFASLVELLDPSLVDGNGSLRGDRYRSFVIRRLKKHIVDPETGECKFKERIVNPIPVKVSSEEFPKFIEMQKKMMDFIAPVLKYSFRTRNYGDVLSFISLLKRSVSSVSACSSTLETVADRFNTILTETSESQESKRQRRAALKEYNRKLERFGNISFEEEEERSELEVQDIVQKLKEIDSEVRSGSYKLKRLSDVVVALDELVDLAKDALDQDPKLHTLIQEIRTIRKEEPKINIIVFTEYTDTQTVIARNLESEKLGRIITISGDDDNHERTRKTTIFTRNDNSILVSTDASAEGLNLHYKCHHVIHFELPFNPNRLEQRNGRIDRYGQSVNPVVRYFYLQGTFEERILLRLIAKYERQRSKLTFVPNTLGLTSSTEASQARLLKGIMDSDEHLFKKEETEFDFYNPDEDSLDDPAVKEMLEEIDKSMKGFDKLAGPGSWFADTGVNADAKLSKEADIALEKGDRAGGVDLVDFVLNAVRADGGTVSEGEIIEITLPPSWNYGLDDLPGYDSAKRKLRLTENIDLTLDANDNPVGFIGRAHPIVRRALDRVRNINYGTGETAGHDRRASAVKGNVKEPQILFTYLGRVSSELGREFEQVIAVQMKQDGMVETYLSANEWEQLADPEKAIKTKDIWKNHFNDWGFDAGENAVSFALNTFRPMADEFIEDRKKSLDAERKQQVEWLKMRAEEIMGGAPEVVQRELFEPSTTHTVPEWVSITDPEKRLASFGNDKSIPARNRHEAETVLKIYDTRIKDINRRSNLKEPEIIPLGLLMLVPEVNYGA